jgi:hypothetical protein
MLPVVSAEKGKNDQRMCDTHHDPDIPEALIHVGPDKPPPTASDIESRPDDPDEHEPPDFRVAISSDDHLKYILADRADKNQPAPQEEIDAVIGYGGFGLLDH